MTVRWSAAGDPGSAAAGIRFQVENGWAIVPLDASPRWLLADNLTGLTLESSTPCQGATVSDVELFQRKSAAALPEPDAVEAPGRPVEER